MQRLGFFGLSSYRQKRLHTVLSLPTSPSHPLFAAQSEPVPRLATEPSGENCSFPATSLSPPVPIRPPAVPTIYRGERVAAPTVINDAGTKPRLNRRLALRRYFSPADQSFHIFCLIMVPLCLLLADSDRRAKAEQFNETFEGPVFKATVSPAAGLRVVSQETTSSTAHTGRSSEQLVLETSTSMLARLQIPLPNAAVIDEFSATLWIHCDQPAAKLAARILLPHPTASAQQHIEVFVAGDPLQATERWQALLVNDLPNQLRARLPALRAEHGPEISLTGAIITGLTVELPLGVGRCTVAIDDLTVTGLIIPQSRSDQLGNSPGLTTPAPASPPVAAAGLVRGVLEVTGKPFFPLAIDHNGESLASLARLGFNCVRLQEPASADLLTEAAHANIWIICPPPFLPEVDLREPEKLPAFSAKWNRVLLWDMGSGLASDDVSDLAEQVRRLRICDRRQGRPVIASADSGLRDLSRHLDMLVARRTVLGTSLELTNYLTWLQQRPRLARPGTPLLTTLTTEIDPRTAAQATLLSGTGRYGLPVDDESLLGAAFTALAAGSRGILFTSSRRLDADDPETIARAAAVQTVNLELETIAAWGASGRFTAEAETSDPEVRAMVIEASRSRVVLVWRAVQGGQIMARHYRGDIPRQEQPLTLLVPGVPEPHRPWSITHSTLRPLEHRRVTGGVAITLDNFHAAAVVLISGDHAATAHVQEIVRRNAPTAALLARSQAAGAIARTSRLAAELPRQALGQLPVTEMLNEAQQEARRAETVLTSDPTTAVRMLERSRSIAGQLERLFWERGVTATGSMVASPLTTSTATLPDHWRLIDALATATPGENLLPAGDMEAIEQLATTGWRHFVQSTADISTAVELSSLQPATGQTSLRMIAAATDPEQAPLVLETPPLWITTPPIQAAAGTLMEISAQVWVPESVQGSVDGLLVFDSYGGPALAERVNRTGNWRRLVLYRIVPPAIEPAAEPPPLTVTFAMTGLGEARLDEVSIRPLNRNTGGASVRPAATGGFARPTDLLGQMSSGLPQEPATTPKSNMPPPNEPEAAWPGMNLRWPNLLPFTQPSTSPPPGPSGSTVDPFRRARGPGTTGAPP